VNCREVSGFLHDYIEGELPEDVRAEFERHLDACTNCHEYLAQYRKTIERSGTLSRRDEPKIPEDLVKAVLDTIAELKR
jgi:anti-sigma factor RsiW